MPNLQNLTKLNRLDDVDNYYRYLLEVRKKYIDELKKLLMSVNEEMTYLVQMINYFNKEIEVIYPVWHELRKELILNGKN